MCGSLVEMQCFPGENKDQDGQENIGCDNTNNHSPHYFLRHTQLEGSIRHFCGNLMCHMMSKSLQDSDIFF